MKPPSSIKRGQRGARPGVPRKSRRHSLLQTQQSENNEDKQGSPHKETEVDTPTPSVLGVSPSSLFRSGEVANAQHALPPFTSTKSAMFPGIPLIPTSVTTKANETFSVASRADSPMDQSTVPRSSTPNKNWTEECAKQYTESSEESDSADTETTPTAESNTNNGKAAAELETDKMTSESPSKAVHAGMPVTVPVYNPSAKTRIRSPVNSLCKRRLMSSGDGNLPKKFPRLILPKSVEQDERILPSGNDSGGVNNNVL